MAKKTKITKEELRTYIPLREEFAVLIPNPDGESTSIQYLSTNILVPPELFGSPEYLYLAGSVNKPEGTPSGYPTHFYLLEDVGGVSKEREYKTFSDDEIRLIIAYYKKYGNEDKKIDIIEAPVPRVYKTTRELSILMTRPRKRGKDLFSLLSDEAEQELREKIATGEVKLLSYLTSGLAFENPLQYKITKSLGKTLYRQTQGYNESSKYDGGGLPEKIVLPQIGSYDKEFSYIVIDPFTFTRETLGRDDIGGNDVQRVMSELANMDNKFYWDDRDRAYYRSLSVEKIKPGTRGGDKGQIVIALRPVYRKGLEKDFINSREDELRLLSGVTSVLSLRLFEVLKEMISYRLPTWKTGRYFDLKETELLERIAVKKSYDNQSGRRLSDFESAVQDMKKIGLLVQKPNNPQRIGKNLRFYVRKDWDLLPEKESQGDDN